MFQTRNYFARFEITLAALDGTGENPTNISGSMLEMSETDQSARLDAITFCTSIKDL